MNRESKPARWLLLTWMTGLLLLCFGPLTMGSAEAAANGTKIEVDGKTVNVGGPVFIFKDKTYVPIAPIAKRFGATTSWDRGNEELTIHTALNDEVVLANGAPVIYFNDVRYKMDAYPFLKGGRLYMPLRELADALHADMEVDAAKDTVKLVTVKPAVVTETYGLDAILKEFGLGKSELLNRNGLAGEAAVKPGTKLKVAVPAFFAHIAKPYTDADLMLLAKITMVESGYEPFEGQLALANVILNRVASTKFPDTIRDVIYSGRQFPPAHNGLLDNSKPNASALRAAKDALNGRNNIGKAVYFYNPEVSTGPFWSSLDAIATIGHHRFAK